jgi:hypothetical protein
MTATAAIGAMASLGISYSFSCPDQVKARAVVKALVGRFTAESERHNGDRENVYRQFWAHISAMRLAQHLANPMPPPPPPGDTVSVLNPASVPKESPGPNRLGFLASGVLLGLIAALAIRNSRSALRLAAFGIAGLLIAYLASFVVPARYTATAVMEINPSLLTEDPAAALPPAPRAAEFLRQIEPKVLSFESLSRMVEDPRLRLNPEGDKTPLEDIVQGVSRGIRIAPMNPQSGRFSISFTQSDRRKAQDGANYLITRFIQESVLRQRESAMNSTQAEIVSRRGGEYLDVRDPPSIPFRPDFPNRLYIAIAGFGIGLLAGAIRLLRHQPATPAIQTA